MGWSFTSIIDASSPTPSSCVGLTHDLDLPLSVKPGRLGDISPAKSVPIPHPTDPLLSVRGRLDLRATGTDAVGPKALTNDALPSVPPDITLFDEGRVFVNVLRVEDENGQRVSRARAGLGGPLRVLSVPEPSRACS